MPQNDALSRTMTAEQLAALDLPGKWTELVRGRLVVREPPGTRHGYVSANALYLLAQYVKPRGLGLLFSQDTGFKVGSNPDTVRAPDVAFVDRDRAWLVRDRGYSSVVPNLVVEVLSPGDSPLEVRGKVEEWLSVGVELAWVVDPDRKEVRVHRTDASVRVVSEHAVLDGDPVFRDFSCSVAQFFA